MDAPQGPVGAQEAEAKWWSELAERRKQYDEERRAEKRSRPPQLCQRCFSARVVELSAKCDDAFWAESVNDDSIGYDGYPRGKPWSDADYIRMKICIECGQIQGKFPVLNEAFVVDDDE